MAVEFKFKWITFSKDKVNQMMPNKGGMMGGEQMMGGQMPGGGMQPGASQGKPDPAQMENQLVGMLKQVKRVAEQNGLSWSDIMSKVEGNESKASATLPRPPAAGAPSSPLG
jgi:hypothetical protein